MEWISVDIQKPSRDTECIIFGDHGVESGYWLTYGSVYQYWDSRDSDGERTRREDEVSHWMPLPEPPEAENEQ